MEKRAERRSKCEHERMGLPEEGLAAGKRRVPPSGDRPGQLALAVGAAPGVAVLLQGPHVGQPERHRALHHLGLGARRLALPTVVTLAIEACVIPCGGDRNQKSLEMHVKDIWIKNKTFCCYFRIRASPSKYFM